MPTPSLIHPIPIKVQLLDRAETLWDGEAREPVAQSIRAGQVPRSGTVIELKAQISYYFASAKQDYMTFDRGGVIEDSIGYFTCRFRDLIHVGLVTVTDGVMTNILLKRGDRLIQIGKEQVDYFIGGFKTFAHYPGYDQTMIQWNFTDRHPGYQQGDL